jgi:carbamoyl-phosphate synthase large subunit
MGFGDRQIAFACGVAEHEVRARRVAHRIKPVYKMVDTCAAEFEAATPYYYSTYESESEAVPKRGRKVVIIGSGPIRIGQGIEFDYCCCHASFALREAGVEAIMINNNPETVSTDFDASDRLYFEPITLEDVLNVIEAEQPEGVIVQFGGQTSINLAIPLAKAGVRILGTQTEGIDVAEDRERFRKLLGELQIAQPANGTAMSEAEALAVARRIGYPVVVRPSYVIAGRAMQIVYNDAELKRYISEAVEVSEERPVLIDKYLENAVECEVDALCDGSDVYIAGIMEHIEKAGIHSGDSSCVTPAVTLSPETQARIAEYTRGIALALKTVGAINIQYAVQNGSVYVLEANPRASRTIPYLSKATGVPLAKMATRILLGATLGALQLPKKQLPYFAVKSVVFPFLKLPGTDFALGPEMKSTGESMGVDKDFGRAYYKALLGANQNIQTSGTVAITLNEADKKRAAELAREFSALGFEIAATDGTAKPVLAAGMRVEVLKKVSEGTPNIVTKLRAGDIALVINTPKRGKNTLTDGFKIRRAAIESNTPCITTLEAAFSLAQALRSAKKNALTLEPIGEYHRMLL